MWSVNYFVACADKFVDVPASIAPVFPIPLDHYIKNIKCLVHSTFQISVFWSIIFYPAADTSWIQICIKICTKQYLKISAHHACTHFIMWVNYKIIQTNAQSVKWLSWSTNGKGTGGGGRKHNHHNGSEDVTCEAWCESKTYRRLFSQLT